MTSILGKKQIVVVLGAHRSGTSAIVRGLRVLSVDLGTNLLGPVPSENAKGFWEDIDIETFNKSLLAKLDTDWHRLAELNVSTLLQPQYKLEFSSAVKLLESKTNAAEIFGFKDPRTAILLPFWQAVFAELDLVDSYVISLRNPVEVAESLRKRNGFPVYKSLLIWAKHALCSVRYTQGRQRVIVSYDGMLADPFHELMRISKALNLAAPDDAKEEYKQYSEEFLTVKLRHNVASEESLKDEAAVPRLVSELYLFLRALAQDKKRDGGQAFEKEWKSFEQRYAEFVPIIGGIDILEFERDREKHRSHHLHKGLAVRDQQLKELAKQLEFKAKELTQSAETIGRKERALLELQAQVESEKVERVSIEQSLKESVNAQNESQEENRKLKDELSYEKIIRGQVEKELSGAKREFQNEQSSRIEIENGAEKLRKEYLDKASSVSWLFGKLMERTLFFPITYLREREDEKRLQVQALKDASQRKKLLGEHVKILRDSKLFDGAWYLRRYQDVAQAGINPVGHYCKHGIEDGRNPSPLFDTRWYLKKYPDVEKEGINPLVHYIRSGVKEKRDPHPLFNTSWYLKQCPNLAESGINPLQHFIEIGGIQGLSPSPYFDSAWYLQNNPDVAESGINPLIHFLDQGAIELRNPSANFDVSWYLERYRDVKNAGINPLVHYVVYGIPEGRNPNATRKSVKDRKAVSPAPRVMRSYSEWAHHAKTELCVIVPVHNAPREVEACLSSVARNTPEDVRVLVIDDASTDPEIDGVLDAAKIQGRIELVRNKKNLGYTGTINKAIGLCGSADVILLNSDTRVPRYWTRNLKWAAYSSSEIGTVTAVSNNAGAFSVPESNADNPLPSGESFEDMSRRINQIAIGTYPTVPTGSGFCLYIKRKYIDEIGLFDEVAFPRGYGEENDFCMRGLRTGWRHIVDDKTFVMHTRNASFGSEKSVLIANASAVINERYPEYRALVNLYFKSKEWATVRSNFRTAFSRTNEQVKPRILYVISTLTGGTPQTNGDLMKAVESDLEPWLLHCDRKVITLYQMINGELVVKGTHRLSRAIDPKSHKSDEYDSVVNEWMCNYAFELMHIRHIAWHSLNLVHIAKNLSIPTIFSIHDFYTICPTVKLLDAEFKFCGGNCSVSKAKDDCPKELWPQQDLPGLKGGWINGWRERMRICLDSVDSLVTTSESAKSILLDNYSDLDKKPIYVIPHGRDFKGMVDLGVCPKSNEKIRIVFPGNLSIAKGALLIEALADLDTNNRLELHFVGKVHHRLSRLGIHHGEYDREKLSGILKEIDPHLGAIFSIWPETYCHTLTELWACTLPVIAFDRGAVGERIRDVNGGWLMDEGDLQGIYDFILELHAKPSNYDQVKRCIRDWQSSGDKNRSLASMAQSYLSVYGKTLGLLGETN